MVLFEINSDDGFLIPRKCTVLCSKRHVSNADLIQVV